MPRSHVALDFSALLVAAMLVGGGDRVPGPPSALAAPTPHRHAAETPTSARRPTAQAPPSVEPPEPKPSPAILKTLKAAADAVDARRWSEVLAAGDRAVAEARSAKDAVGEAQGHLMRSVALGELKRDKEMAAAWHAAE